MTKFLTELFLSFLGLNNSSYAVRNSALDTALPFTTAAVSVLTSHRRAGHCKRPSDQLSTVLVVSPVVEEAAKLPLNHETKSVTIATHQLQPLFRVHGWSVKAT
jgi:hypothetical protein